MTGKELLTTLEDELVTYCEQYALLNGELPSVEKLSAVLLAPESTVELALSKSEVRNALDRRGVLLQTPGYRLSAEQLAVANTILDFTDGRSEKRKLDDLGVSSAKYQAWLSQPAFQSYIKQRSENLLGNTQHVAHTALVDSVRSGDVQAIKYYNELTGRFSSKSVGEMNVQYFMAKVLEVIQRHCDPDTMRLIAAEFEVISNPSNNTKELANG
jgi:Helix-turn-helix of insertion element transposase